LDLLNAVKGVLFGTAIGDALGVPVEFLKREQIKKKPVTEFIGYGTHNQPPGTFSDDSAMTFCLAEALTTDFNLENVAYNFLEWTSNNYWAATERSFGFGHTTINAMFNLQNGMNPELAGGIKERDNGNGSLMRISPLAFYTYKMSISNRFEIIKKVSSITHRHIRSIIACFYFIEFMIQILEGYNLFDAYKNLQIIIPDFLKSLSIEKPEIDLYDRLLLKNIFELSEDEIESSGYVIHTLEASVWCLLTTNNYEEAVLKAVNLGGDTDTTGCVTGGIAGLYYGYDNIPEKWTKNILKCEKINDLAERLYRFLFRAQECA